MVMKPDHRRRRQQPDGHAAKHPPKRPAALPKRTRTRSNSGGATDQTASTSHRHSGGAVGENEEVECGEDVAASCQASARVPVDRSLSHEEELGEMIQNRFIDWYLSTYYGCK